MKKASKELAGILQDSKKKGTKAYDTQAVVKRIEGNTAWVHIPGGVDETPVRMTMNASAGDTVQVRVTDGTAFLVGNASAPPTDDRTANFAVGIASGAAQGLTVLNNVVANSIEATTARFGVVEADTAKIHDLTADQLTATVGYIDDLTSKNITAENIEADHIAVGNLEGTYAKIQDLNAARGRIDNLEANEAVVNDTLKATNAEVEYLSSDWISTDRLVLTGNNKNNYPPVQITEAEFNVNKTAYWTKDGNNYTQCTTSSVYDPDEQYYVRQTVQSIIEAINTANNTDPQVVVSNDKLIAASMDVAELSAITADMGTLTAGKIQKGNNFINLNTVPASMEFKNASTWASATQGIQFDTQGNLNIKGKVEITSSNTIPTKQELSSAVNKIEGLNITMTVSGSNLVFRATLVQGGTDITNTIPDGDFEWFYRTPSGDVPMNLNGKTITIAKASQEYGRTVVCVWTRNQYAYLLNNNGNNLVTNTGAKLIGRSEY